MQRRRAEWWQPGARSSGRATGTEPVGSEVSRVVSRTGPEGAWLSEMREVSKTVSGLWVRRGFKSLPLRFFAQPYDKLGASRRRAQSAGVRGSPLFRVLTGARLAHGIGSVSRVFATSNAVRAAGSYDSSEASRARVLARSR